MKKLILIRHAKSSWKQIHLSDFDRPLNKRGMKDAKFMSSELSNVINSVDALFSSSSNRTKLTTNFFLEKIKIDKEKIFFLDNFYHSDSDHLFNSILSLNDSYSSIIFVGHNPGFTNITNFLLGSSYYNVPTCGIIIIEFVVNKWSLIEKNSGKLLNKMFPKDYR